MVGTDITMMTTMTPITFIWVICPLSSDCRPLLAHRLSFWCTLWSCSSISASLLLSSPRLNRQGCSIYGWESSIVDAGYHFCAWSVSVKWPHFWQLSVLLSSTLCGSKLSWNSTKLTHALTTLSGSTRKFSLLVSKPAQLLSTRSAFKSSVLSKLYWLWRSSVPITCSFSDGSETIQREVVWIILEQFRLESHWKLQL